jgi:hypothetical protein
MTVRVTLRLPDNVYQRLAHASQESKHSLNEVIVRALERSDLTPARPEGMTPQQLLNWALRDLGGPLSETEIAALAWDDEELPDISDAELDALLQGISPPVSQTIIDDREDRF